VAPAHISLDGYGGRARRVVAAGGRAAGAGRRVGGRAPDADVWFCAQRCD